MKTLRVLVAAHANLVPRRGPGISATRQRLLWRTEADVLRGLAALGHEVETVGLDGDPAPLTRAIDRVRPDVVFNLIADFYDDPAYEMHIPSYLELFRIPYTGCNPQGILLSGDKALSKLVLRDHGVRTPRFAVCPRGRQRYSTDGIPFPVIVKPRDECSSIGIARASVVHGPTALRKRVDHVHRHVMTDAIVEEYIDGRELTIGVLGNRRLRTLPIWETHFGRADRGGPRFLTHRMKWNPDYCRSHGIRSGPARRLPPGVAAEIDSLARRAYRTLGLSGFGRIDFRLAGDGRPFVVDVNANPDLDFREALAQSAKLAGWSGPELLQSILDLALAYRRLLVS